MPDSDQIEDAYDAIRENQLSFNYRPTNGELQGDVSVQSTRSTTAHKSFSINKSGNVQ